MSEPSAQEQLLQLNAETFAAEAKQKIGEQDWDQYLYRVLADDFRIKRANLELLPQDKRQMITHIQYDLNPLKRGIIGEPKVLLDGDYGIVTSSIRLPGRPNHFHNLKVFARNLNGDWQCVYWRVRELVAS